jgi:hypothetical protein
MQSAVNDIMLSIARCCLPQGSAASSTRMPASRLNIGIIEKFRSSSRPIFSSCTSVGRSLSRSRSSFFGNSGRSSPNNASPRSANQNQPYIPASNKSWGSSGDTPLSRCTLRQYAGRRFATITLLLNRVIYRYKTKKSAKKPIATIATWRCHSNRFSPLSSGSAATVLSA